MTFREYAEKNIVILDGGMGTLLEGYGILPSETAEDWNITKSDIITEIHKQYFDAGSNVVNTNTFGANILKFDEEKLGRIIAAAVENAKRAKNLSVSKDEKFISLDIGPTGKMLKPFGELEFERAYEVFKKTAELGVKLGVDLITIETMTDSMETKAALLAVKDTTDLPVIVTNAYGTDGKLLTGASGEVMTAILEGMGADYIGANCGGGPKSLFPVIEELLENASVPVVFKPNAGIPESINGKTEYNVLPEEFARDVKTKVLSGARLVGGCCGTTPEYIKALSKALSEISPKKITPKDKTVITSYCKAQTFGEKITLIGESINPTGKKRMKLAVEEGDIDFIVNTAVTEEEYGANALDVNVGVPGINEAEFMEKAVSDIQYSVSVPLVIDSSNPEAIESALRIYNGKALINSVNGKKSSMKSIFPLMKKYGAAAIALTLDENGIPATTEGRINIVRKILREAKKFGIPKKDLIFDPLAMAVSADKNGALVTLETVKRIKTEFLCHTSLGVSNISFGLPKRDVINSTFFTMAIECGLSAAIMNPMSAEMMKSYYASVALLGLDENFKNYTAITESIESAANIGGLKETKTNENVTLEEAIVKGLKEKAVSLTAEMLKTTDAMDIVNGELIPALDKVGKAFEEGRVYLPGLLLSAETAKGAFEVIKGNTPVEKSNKNGKIVIATVKGDIHDIGKNIVKLLLENYGFDVIDLGKDVAPEKIIDSAISEKADIIALSALMTTTVPEMEKTIALAKKMCPEIKVIVGGAVLTEEYAKKIGADAYGKDAMSAVRYAEKSVVYKK